MFRIYLCGALSLSTFMISAELHRLREKEADEPKRLAEAVSKMIPLVCYDSADVYTLSKSAMTGFPEFSKITAGNFPEQWKSACKTIHDPESAKLMSLCGDILGSSDGDSQIERLRLLRSDLRARAEELNKRCQGTKRLYYTLGALSGLAVSVMMI